MLVYLSSIEMYLEYGIHAWDIAAGGLIAEEAGAILANPDNSPEPFDLGGKCSAFGAICHE